MEIEKCFDLRGGRNEISCEVRKLSLSDHDKERDVVSSDGSQLIGLVPYATVVCEGYPIVPAAGFQPFFVRASRGKVITVPFDAQPSGRKEVRKSVA